MHINSVIRLTATVILATTLSTTALASGNNDIGNQVNVAFERGKYSANYYGRLDIDKYDSYNFIAKKGQKIKIKVAGGVEPYLFNRNLPDSIDLGEYSPELDRYGRYTLPYSGKYELRITQPRTLSRQGKKPKYWLEIAIR